MVNMQGEDVMKILKQKIGQNSIYQYVDDHKVKFISPATVINSWDNSINIIEEDEKKSSKGLRTAQIGAIFAIKSHWTVSGKPATIVMPTGTGKTETMIVIILSEKCKKTLIIVPSKLLRNQTVKKFISLGILNDINVVKSNIKYPIVACLSSTPSNADELDHVLKSANVIISTMSLLAKFDCKYLNIINKECTNIIIDEAHHIEANTWSKFKGYFKDKKCLQFTATPFRNDGKKIDGKIIYNFPLLKAQEQNYFKPIHFCPIYEFDESRSDLAIARKAVEYLEKDIQNGLSHILLVRAKTRERAIILYKNVYNKHFQKYNPVLIISGIGECAKKEALEKIKLLKSRILVCVDMFGEGIDIPNLKIAAIHDKYKSLPITLQFIGRFARSKEGLGDATVVANIANDDVKESLQELYAQDSDWNTLLRTMSDDAIGKEISLQELAQGFLGTGIKEMNIKQIVPKVSMVPFMTTDSNWLWENWKKAFDESKCYYYINDNKKVLIIIEMVDSCIEWANIKDIYNINWQLHIVYWNPNMKMFFINTTNKSIVGKLADSVFPNNKRIKGEVIFRCLYGINRLMLATVGLNSAIDGPIRYKMFAGIDISEGLTESQKENCIKSNLFGVGYDGRNKVSIGCSYKGTIWAHWVETVDFWMNWCDDIAKKITNPDINVSTILEGALVPHIIDHRPNVTPYKIDWPIDLEIRNDDKIGFKLPLSSYPIYNVDIKLITNDDTSPIRFYIGNENFREEFELVFNKENFTFKKIKNANAEVYLGSEKLSTTQFFNEYPPTIKFVDQSTLEGNLFITLKNSEVHFDKSKVIVWNWNQVDIHKESQGISKEKDSIQYKVINDLKKNSDYCIIFDDDNAGEIADIVTINEIENNIKFEFYHCKYAHGEKPGARVSDLYEVCGQAEKSVIWRQDTKNIIDRMIERENDRVHKTKVSRFEKGDLRKLKEIKNKLKIYSSTIDVFIVQPGVKSTEISSQMERLLCGTSTYLADTYGLKFRLICS